MLDELLPYHPKHQLAMDGPVPYNVYDGFNLKDQLMVRVNQFSKNRKSNKITTRDSLLSKVSNNKLKNAINEMYRSTAKIGEGGLASAIRVESKYGVLVGGKSHRQKGEERLKNIENIMKKEKLSVEDWKIANELVIDLKRELNGK